MQKVVEQIPNYKLRRVDMIPSADGSLKPNPFWIEIYEPKRRRYRSKRRLETTGNKCYNDSEMNLTHGYIEGSKPGNEDSSASKRVRSSMH